MVDHPQLFFIAGPNGAGKSTFSKLLSAPGAIIFDVDKVIAQLETQSPQLSKKQIYQEATDEFFGQAKEAVNKLQDFTLETNFRDDHLMDVVTEFKRFGYTANMVYLSLESIDLSTLRVEQRVVNGGHFVDQKNLKQNFEIGLEYLERYADHFDNIEVVDGSSPGGQLRSLLSVQERELKYMSNNLPKALAKTIHKVAAKFPSPPKQQQRRHKGPRL